ncbi:MAG: FTR1 family protein [Gammaproteobacteria bacterium]|jgi:high-affinity iron transporter|nr:FTR1 family protein [Gammaproteobacteria bacterium]|tara:strand:- start:204 stop:1049 length:846 start_codon:yes stop_codon:yes gene_type:complete
MFLDAVILILQEILEAALVISVLLVLTHLFQTIWGRDFSRRKSWFFYALILGIFGAWLYAYFIPEISDWFDYVGQEVMNSSIHLVSLLFLIVLACVAPSRYFAGKQRNRSKLAVCCMAIIVLLALVREGSEIILYLEGVTSQSENVSPVLLGAIVGAGIGVSSGIFLFYTLVSLNSPWPLRLCLLLLALISGSMASQTVMLLTQADWLPYTSIAWDSSGVLSESSVVGRVFYALIGYEATPSILQVVCYFLSMLIIVSGPLFRLAWPRKKSLEKSVSANNA